jgi:hypothetical protein
MSTGVAWPVTEIISSGAARCHPWLARHMKRCRSFASVYESMTTYLACSRDRRLLSGNLTMPCDLTTSCETCKSWVIGFTLNSPAGFETLSAMGVGLALVAECGVSKRWAR